MQAYFMTRGKYEEVQTLIDWLRHQVLPLKMQRPDGTTQAPLMECMVRPIQLWEFVFPREYLDLVSNSLGLSNKNQQFFQDGKNPPYNINPKLWALRKLLGAKEFPTPATQDKLMMPYERFKNVNILPIGYVEDGDIAELTHERI